MGTQGSSCPQGGFLLISPLVPGADNLHNPAESLPLAMAKEAKVSELEDDQLAEEDLPVLDTQ